MPKEIKHIIVPFDRKEVSQEGDFQGYGSVFGNVDYGFDVVEKGAFEKSLDSWRSKGQLPAMLYSHDMREPIGDWKEMSEDNTGLKVSGSLWLDDVPRAKQARRMMLGTGPKGLSIGYIATREEHGERDGNRVRFLKEVDLMEVSPVVFAMNSAAMVTDAKERFCQDSKLADIRSFEKALCSALDITAKQAKILLSEGYAGLKREVEGQERDAGIDSLLESLKSLQEITAI